MTYILTSLNQDIHYKQSASEGLKTPLNCRKQSAWDPKAPPGKSVRLQSFPIQRLHKVLQLREDFWSLILGCLQAFIQLAMVHFAKGFFPNLNFRNPNCL